MWLRRQDGGSRWQRVVTAGVWLLGVYLAAGQVVEWSETAADAQGPQAAVVVRVIDGDTIEVEIEGATATVRLMGIDTPETKQPARPVEYYGPEAAALADAALSGMTIHLTTDRTGDREDAYGRWFRYVEVGGVDFNAALVREGYARAVRGFAYARRAEFIALENDARSRGVGLWAARAPG